MLPECPGERQSARVIRNPPAAARLPRTLERVDCYTCAYNAAPAHELPPRELIAADEHWRVAHAIETPLPGWLVLLPRRHVTAIAELTDAEAAGLGYWQVRLSRALASVTGCAKTYLAQFAERRGFAHVHFHVIPRAIDHPVEALGPRVLGLLGTEPAVTTAEMDEIALRLREVLQTEDMTRNGYQISTDRERLDAGLVHHWLSTDAYWALGCDRDTVERSIAGSLNFGVYGPDGHQVGYARVVTDLATFGWLCDVYVDRAHRGRGIGTWLAAAVRDHLAPYRLRRLMLVTEDAHGVYAKAGFAPVENPEKLMRLGPSA